MIDNEKLNFDPNVLSVYCKKHQEHEPEIEEVKLFWNYVCKIYKRCQKKEHTQDLWEDFPCDMWLDRENWQGKQSVAEIKCYIDYVKSMHTCVKESARMFWSHWLNYKNNHK